MFALESSLLSKEESGDHCLIEGDANSASITLVRDSVACGGTRGENEYQARARKNDHVFQFQRIKSSTRTNSLYRCFLSIVNHTGSNLLLLTVADTVAGNNLPPAAAADVDAESAAAEALAAEVEVNLDRVAGTDYCHCRRRRRKQSTRLVETEVATNCKTKTGSEVASPTMVTLSTVCSLRTVV